MKRKTGIKEKSSGHHTRNVMLAATFLTAIVFKDLVTKLIKLKRFN